MSKTRARLILVTTLLLAASLACQTVTQAFTVETDSQTPALSPTSAAGQSSNDGPVNTPLAEEASPDNPQPGAAGFGDLDPIASNGTKDGRQQNRRCELIVVPALEEMLDLKSLTESP